MKNFIQQNLQQFQKKCEEYNLSEYKILTAPKCYNKEVMYIQNPDFSNTGKGLANNKPADILLIIRKEGNSLEFEQTEFTKTYLAN